MKENELKSLWQSANDKLTASLRLVKSNTEDLTKLKIQNGLVSMKPIKLFALMVGVIWVIGLGSVLVFLVTNHGHSLNVFFLFSATIQVLLTALAIAVYVYQLGLLQKIDFSGPVVIIQEIVAKLSASTLNVTRILFLQLPFWTTFYWNEKMFTAEHGGWWVLQGIVTGVCTYVSVWLFFNIKFENRNKKWFQWIFKGREWKPILNSMEFLNQIEQYKG